MDGKVQAMPDGSTHLDLFTGRLDGGGIYPRAIGFYGPGAAVPEGTWKWNGLYD
jgi:hypothetical protein